MSYEIENLKFTIFGHGHDVVRNDSGSGRKAPRTLNLSVQYAVIDENEDYVWFVTNKCVKYRTSDWTEVETDIDENIVILLHPNNVQNNIGVGITSSNYAYIFDLTDDSIINEGQLSTSYIAYIDNPMDCIVVEDVIYFCTLWQGRVTNRIYWIDKTDMSNGDVRVDQRGFSGFVSDDIIYATNPVTTISEYERIYGYNKSGVAVWENRASIQGSGYFENVKLGGFGGNGKLYALTHINGKWTLGEYNALTAPDFNNPNPSKTFGEFESTLWDIPNVNRSFVAYSDEREFAIISTSEGVLFTDFNDCEFLGSEIELAYACSPNYVICSDRLRTKVNIYAI